MRKSVGPTGTFAKWRAGAGCVCALNLAACAASAPKAEEPVAPSESAPAEGASPAAEPSEPAPAAAPSEPASDSGAAATPSPASAVATPLEVCGQMCDRMAQRCSESAVKSCRLNCKKQYQSPPKGCDDYAREALECARDASDLQCAAIAPMSCNPAFLRFQACTRGEKIETKAQASTTPAGWERFAAKSAGFSALMPRGVTEKAEGGEPTFSAEDGSVTYSVRVKKAPAEKPTQKTLVKVALDMLGVQCSKNLRLHGMIEQGSNVTIRFDSDCKDGKAYKGQFVVTGGRMYVLQLVGPKGFKADHEAFFAGFTAS
jgi:hypothetical protein